MPGQHSEAKVYIRYSKKREGTALANKLVKPFIVVEGYDLNDVAPLLDKENYTINSLLQEWDNLFKETSYDLSDQLDDDAGYDLVFVQYYTMDYIENNANMLEKVIDQLNTLKVNNASGIREKNVVMGISLGGVLSRFTLAKMTKNRGTSSTDTRLLLTYDSPHQGGNVPLGFQHFLYDFGEVQIAGTKFKEGSPELAQFYTLSSQPATSQLLLLRATDANGTVQQNTFFASGGSYRTMVDFNATQMANTPPSYEFKAISQGSQCGTWVMQPHTILTSTSGNAATARWVAFGIVISKYNLTVELNALPQQGESKRISYVKMEREIRLFWGLIGTGWKTMYEKARFSPIGVIPYDCVPGGTSSALERSGGGINSDFTYPRAKDWYLSKFWDGVLKPILSIITFTGISTNLHIPFQQDIFTTVPINSSLDLQNVSTSTFNQSYIYPINGLAGSRSVKYIANESFAASVNGNSTTLYNYEHADFTKRQSQWMYNEMEGFDNSLLNCEDAQTCVATNFTITGSNLFCTSETYALNPLPPSTQINWSVSPSGIVNLISNPDKSVTLTKINNGVITLTGSFSFCNNQPVVVSKQVTAGTPSPYFGGTFNDGGSGTNQPLESTYNEVYNNTVYISLSGSPTEFTWDGFYTNGNVSWYHPVGNDGLVINFNSPVNYGDYIGFSIHRTNVCGTATEPLLFYYVGENQYYYSVAPNPVHSSFSIKPTKQKTIEASKNNKEINIDLSKVQILDKFGKIVFEKNYQSGTKDVTIDAAALKSDVYTVRLFLKNKIEIHRIIVQH